VSTMQSRPFFPLALSVHDFDAYALLRHCLASMYRDSLVDSPACTHSPSLAATTTGVLAQEHTDNDEPASPEGQGSSDHPAMQCERHVSESASDCGASEAAHVALDTAIDADESPFLVYNNTPFVDAAPASHL